MTMLGSNRSHTSRRRLPKERTGCNFPAVICVLLFSHSQKPSRGTLCIIYLVLSTIEERQRGKKGKRGDTFVQRSAMHGSSMRLHATRRRCDNCSYQTLPHRKLGIMWKGSRRVMSRRTVCVCARTMRWCCIGLRTIVQPRQHYFGGIMMAIEGGCVVVPLRG